MHKIKFFLVLSLLFATGVALAHKGPARFDFRENKGQWHEKVRFRSEYGSATLFAGSRSLTWVTFDERQFNNLHDLVFTSGSDMPVQLNGHTLRVHFDGADEPELEGQEMNSAYYNYFVGKDASKWVSNVKSYSALRYKNIWPGVGMRLYNSGVDFKYDFIIEPDASIAPIALLYEGAESIYLVNGDLHVRTSVGVIVEKAPFAYQMKDGKIEKVACNFVLSENRLTFEFPDGYDSSRKLIIDPVIVASTLSGSPGNNWAFTGTHDNEGNIFAAGICFQADYNVSPGAFQAISPTGGITGNDLVISKFNGDGSALVWGTYLSGTGNDYPHSMIVNELNELHVFGTTGSSDFPITTNAYATNYAGGNSDLFVSRLSEDGTALIASTYVGGSGTDGENEVIETFGATYRGEINLDADGNVIIATCTRSTNFPVSANAAQPALSGLLDGVVFSLTPDLNALVVSSYIGGGDLDAAYGIRASSSGLIFVTGTTRSPDFPVTPGAYQTTFEGGSFFENASAGWLAQLSADGTQWNAVTYFLTPEDDTSLFVELDDDEDVWITGQTFGNTPIIGDVYADENGSLFIAKFNQELNELLTATRFGVGWGVFAGANQSAFGIDQCGNINISYQEARAEAVLPLTDDAFFDAGIFYMTVFSKDAEQLLFASRYPGNEIHGGTSRFDDSGILYQAVCATQTFYTTPNALSSSAIAWDVAAFKIDFQLGSSVAIPELSAEDASGCAPHTVAFENNSLGSIFEWNFGDGSPPSFEAEPVHTFETPGVYDVTLISIDTLACNLPDTALIQVIVSAPVEVDVDFTFTSFCESISVSTNNLSNNETLSYVWDMGDSTIVEGFNVNHTYSDYGTYEVTLTAINDGCELQNSVSQEVELIGPPIAAVENESITSCDGTAITFNNTGFGQSFVWDFGDGSPPSTAQSPEHTFPGPGEYTVTLTAESMGECGGVDVLNISVIITGTLLPEALFTSVQTGACEALTVDFSATGSGDDFNYQWDIEGLSYNTANPTHAFGSEGMYTVSLTVTEPLCEITSTYTDEVLVLGGNMLEGATEQYLCNNAEASIGIDGPPGTLYLWETGETTPTITVSSPGQYLVTATMNNCSEVRTIEVAEIAELNLLTKTVGCGGDEITLRIPYQGGSDFRWCSGETTDFIKVSEAGEYCYTFVDNFGCAQQGRFVLEVTERDIYIPNAFTPDADGLNEVFRVYGEDLSDFTLTVWSRWGEKVFETNDPEGSWNGAVQGGNYFPENEIYVYRVVYRSSCNADVIERNGHVLLIR